MVDLYFNPLFEQLVLSAGEKAWIQALDRSQALDHSQTLLSYGPGRPSAALRIMACCS